MNSGRLAAQTSASLVGVDVDFAGHPALRQVHVDIPAGWSTVIVGPNGSGKSTLLEVLARTRAPAAGHVMVAAASTAFVPQSAAIPGRLPMTVHDVVLLGAWGTVGRWRRVGAASRRAVDDAIDRLALGALRRAPFQSLSGGQRQRTLLAQALARTADLLLLDEPTSGLDADSSGRIHEAIRDEAARGAAVVCVSHDDDMIARADRVVRLQGGRIVSDSQAG